MGIACTCRVIILPLMLFSSLLDLPCDARITVSSLQRQNQIVEFDFDSDSTSETETEFKQEETGKAGILADSDLDSYPDTVSKPRPSPPASTLTASTADDISASTRASAKNPLENETDNANAPSNSPSKNETNNLQSKNQKLIIQKVEKLLEQVRGESIKLLSEEKIKRSPALSDCTIRVASVAQNILSSVKNLEELPESNVSARINSVGKWVRETSDVKYRCSKCLNSSGSGSTAPSPTSASGPLEAEDEFSDVDPEERLRACFNAVVVSVYSLMKAVEIKGGYQVLSQLQL